MGDALRSIGKARPVIPVRRSRRVGMPYLCVFLLGQSLSTAALPADPPGEVVVERQRNGRGREITDEQRDRGMSRVQDLIRQADQLKGTAQHREAVQLLEQGVSIVDSLYPP